MMSVKNLGSGGKGSKPLSYTSDPYYSAFYLSGKTEWASNNCYLIHTSGKVGSLSDYITDDQNKITVRKDFRALLSLFAAPAFTYLEPITILVNSDVIVAKNSASTGAPIGGTGSAHHYANATVCLDLKAGDTIEFAYSVDRDSFSSGMGAQSVTMYAISKID